MLRPLRLLLPAVALAGCGGDRSPRIESGRPVIEAARLVSAQNAGQRYYAGRVIAVDQVQLAFEIAGRVEEVAVDIGDRFEAGDTLARLDAVDAELALQRTRAELQDARAAAEEARRNLERTTTLARSKAASEAALDQAEALAERTEAQVSALKVALDQARERLADTQLTAPYGGTVAQRRVEPAQTVHAGQTAFAIDAAGDGYEIAYHVPARDLARLRQGDVVTVVPAALDQRLVAIVTHVARSAGPQGLYEVRARLESPPATLAPGMAADVLASGRSPEGALLAPMSAVVAGREGQGRVMAIDMETGAVSARDVRILAVMDAGLVIGGDVGEGDIVAARGAQHLSDGTKVETVGLPDATARYNN